MFSSRKSEKSPGWSKPLVLVIVAASFLGGSLTTYVLQRFFQTSRARDLSSSQQISHRQAESGGVSPAVAISPPVLPTVAPVAAPAPGVPPAAPAAAAAPTPVSDPQAPASLAPAAATDALPTRVEVQKGEGLAKIINHYYPGEYRKGLAAIVLANPELDGAEVIRPGQVIILPRIDFRSRSVQLNDGLFYTLYGSYYSAASWHGDKPWLEKSGVRFLVRVSRDAAGKTLHRVFLGGYERLEDLRAAQQVMHARSKHGRLPWGEVLAITAPPARKDDAVKPKAPAPSTAPPAAPTSQTSAPPVPDPTAAKQPPVAAPTASLPASLPEAAPESAAATPAEEPGLGGEARQDTPRLSARLSAWCEAMGARLAGLGQFFQSREPGAPQESVEPSETPTSADAAALSASESRPAAPPAVTPTPMADLLNRQATANKGESLTQIAIRNYGSRDKTILTALILANEEIDTENMIHPGQVISLPRVDLPEQIIQLPDGRYYALYGRYHSAGSWEGDKPWLEKNGVRFLVRVTRDAAGGKVQRIFLGGYDKVADLQAARQRLQIKSRRAGRPPETTISMAGSQAPEDREAPDQPAAPPGKLTTAEAVPESLNATASSESPASPPRESRPAGLSLGPPWLNSLTFAPPAAEMDSGATGSEARATPETRPLVRETATPPVALAPAPTAEIPAREGKSAPGSVSEPKAAPAPATRPAPQTEAYLLTAMPQLPEAAVPPGDSPPPEERQALNQPAAPPGKLATAEAFPESLNATGSPEPPASPPRESRPGRLSLGPPWLNSLGFSSPAAELDAAPNSPESTVIPAAPPPARETAAPQVVMAPVPATSRPAAESKSTPGPVAEPQAAPAPAAPSAPPAGPPLLAALPKASQISAPTAKTAVLKDRQAPEQPAAPPSQLAAAESPPPGLNAEAPAKSPFPPRESRPAGLSLGPPWLNSLGPSSPAAELDATPTRPESTVIPAAPPSARETPAPSVALAPAPADEIPAGEGKSAPGPVSEAQAAPATKVSLPLENEAPLPEAMLPEAAPSLPLLKFPAGLTDSFQLHWHSRMTVPGGLWPLLKSLWQALVPAGSLPALEPQAKGEEGQGPGLKTPVLAATGEVAPTSEALAPASPEALALAPTSPTNIRRYLDAGGVFHIENRNPDAGRAELYVEPRPEALESFLKANNEVPRPAADNAPAGQPLREVSWPSGVPAPLPVPDSKAAEKVLPPEGTIRRYRDALGVLHVANGELHNPGNPGEALLARLDPEPREAAPGSGVASEPAGQAAKGGWPITRVAFPKEKNAPVLPAAPTPREKALAPEDLIRRYRDVKGVLHIVNREPKEPASHPATILAGAVPADSSGKSDEPKADDRHTVVWPIKAASLTTGERRLPIPPEPAPPESPWVNEGAIRRYRDAKGVLHIKTTEYPKPPLPPDWPAVGRLAGNLPFKIPGLPSGAGRGAPTGLPQNPKVPEVVAFRDQRGRLQISSLGPRDLARKTALELNRAGLEPIIVEAALSYRLPVPLIQAVIKMESNFVPWAVSPKGAMGLMQLMPGTADFLGVTEPFNPRENILGGCRYLRLLLDCFNDNLALALAAYNAGYQRVIEAGYRVPEIKETQDFVAGVLSRYYSLVLVSRPAKI